MLSVSLMLFILIYGAGLVVIAIFFLFNLFHLIHTGTITFWSTLATLVTVGFMFFVLATTWTYIGTLDWGQPIIFGNNTNSFPL